MRRPSLWVAGIALALVAAIAMPASAWSQTLVGQWNMDDTSGMTMVDSSPNGYSGAVQGAVVLGTFPGVTASTNDFAYQFNEGTTCDPTTETTTGSGAVVVSRGVTGVSSSTTPTFNPGTQPFSFSMWIQTTASPGNPVSGTVCDFDLIRKAGGWKMEIYPFQKIPQPNCVWNGVLNGGTVKVNLHKPLPTGSIIDGNWHHITCSRDASGESLIVDGTILARSSVNVGNIQNKANVFLGAQSQGADYYIGLMDDVAFSIG